MDMSKEIALKKLALAEIELQLEKVKLIGVEQAYLTMRNKVDQVTTLEALAKLAGLPFDDAMWREIFRG